MDTPFLEALRVYRRWEGYAAAPGPGVGFAAAAACAAMGAKTCFLAAEAPAPPPRRDFLAELAGVLRVDAWAEEVPGAPTRRALAVASRGSQVPVRSLFAAARALGPGAPEADHLLGAAFGYLAPGAAGFGPVVVWVAEHEGARGVMWAEGLGLCLPPDGAEVDLRQHTLELAAAPAAVEAVVVSGLGGLEAELAKYRG